MNMTLTVRGSGSNGNCYIIQNEDEAIILEAGLPFDNEVKKALGWDVAKIQGVLCTHYHNDHAGYLKQYDSAGFSIFTLPEVIEKKGISEQNARPLSLSGRWEKVGGFKVLPFPLVHYNTDGSRCPICGFLIIHKDAGRICFFTDCQAFSREVVTDDGRIDYVPYDFTDVNHWLMEANYDDYILHMQDLAKPLKDRIRRSHMSLNNVIKAAKRLDLSSTREILLIHLSNGNSDDRKFVREMRKATGKRVYAAIAGLRVDYNLNLI